jgi:phosphoribosyl 1,2-cyclic phosphodiesterase
VLTHAHEDHAGGLRGGSPCPVFATAVTLEKIVRFGVAERRVVEPRRPFELAGLTFEAFPVEHSLRAPAVGFRIASASGSLFYVPDVVAIPDRRDALGEVDLYVGDGAAITRQIIRTRDGIRIGHASIREQLKWCASEGVAKAIFTHCGAEIVRGDGRTLAARVRLLGRGVGVGAAIARDGLRLDVAALNDRGRP